MSGHDWKPTETHGALMEGVHLASYSLRRAVAKLKWLLEEDRWMECGPGYDDVNMFYATLEWDTVKMSATERKGIVELMAAAEGASARQIGRTLGVSDQTVRRDLGATNVAPREETPRPADRDSNDGATNVAIEDAEVIDVGNEMVTEEHSKEVYTPEPIIEAARASMGGIDLDPASCEEAQATVRATRWVGLPDDGLEAEWAGRVWCNPPYSSSGMRTFARHLIAAHEAGDVTAACFLAYFAGSNWVTEITAASSTVVLLPSSALRWWGPSSSAPRFLSFAVWCLGDVDPALWRGVGTVMRVEP